MIYVLLDWDEIPVRYSTYERPGFVLVPEPVFRLEDFEECLL